MGGDRPVRAELRAAGESVTLSPAGPPRSVFKHEEEATAKNAAASFWLVRQGGRGCNVALPWLPPARLALRFTIGLSLSFFLFQIFHILQTENIL